MRSDKCIDGFHQLPGALEARPAQCFAGKNAKPDFYLVEPTGRRWREVEVYAWMLCPPVMILFAGTIIVGDHMNFLVFFEPLPQPHP